MKRITFILITLTTFFLASCSTLDKVNLRSFSPENNNFSVLMPGNPRFQTQTVNTAVGLIEIKMYISEVDGIAYLIDSNEYPEKVIETSPKLILDGARNGAVKNVYGKLISETIISLDGYPGRELNIAIADGGARARIYLVKNALYQLIVVGPGEKLYLGHVHRMFESFKLTNKQ